MSLSAQLQDIIADLSIKLPSAILTGDYPVLERYLSSLVQEFSVNHVAINQQGGSYILTLADDGQFVDMDVAVPCTLTVPSNSSVPFAVGTTVTIRQKGAGQVTITPAGGGVILQYKDGLKTSGQYAVASLVKVATNTWAAFGALVA